MRFLIVGQKNVGQIQRLKAEAKKLRHTIDGCLMSDLVIESGDGVFNVFANKKPLSSYDLIYLCAGIEQNRRFEWYTAVDYLKKHFKTKIVNEVVVDPSLKYYPIQTWFILNSFENSIPIPKTFIIYSKEKLPLVLKKFNYPLIIKISELHRGTGVFLAKTESDVKKIIGENEGKTFLLKKFIPNDGDFRVLTVGFRAVGAMKRKSKFPEFRNNISVGSKGESIDFKECADVIRLAEKAAKASGIEIAGVDVITDNNTGKNYVLEVNVGPQFTGLEKYTDINAAREIIKYFESKCNENLNKAKTK